MSSPLITAPQPPLSSMNQTPTLCPLFPHSRPKNNTVGMPKKDVSTYNQYKHFMQTHTNYLPLPPTSTATLQKYSSTVVLKETSSALPSVTQINKSLSMTPLPFLLFYLTVLRPLHITLPPLHSNATNNTSATLTPFSIPFANMI